MPWDEIIGQKYAKKILKNSLRSNHLHHAYLFYGPSGCGKALTAKVYAQALNCQEFEGGGCGKCFSCRLIEDGTHPDVIRLLPLKEEFSIKQVREIKRELSYKPIMGRRKVCVLLGVERLTREAANALLVSLEEPPPEVTFIMSTTSPYRLLPTLLSRCQPIRFGSLPKEKIEEALLSWGFSKDAIPLMTTLCEGSLGRAKEYIDNEILKREGIITTSLRNIEEGGFRSVFEIAEVISKGRVLEDLILILSILRRSFEPWVLLPIMEGIVEIERGIRSHTNIQLALEVLFLEHQRIISQKSLSH